jgi:hypothetical protein
MSTSPGWPTCQKTSAHLSPRSGVPGATPAGESTVPGLYFVGAPAAFGLGPSMRFIAGTHNGAAQLTQSVVRRARGSKGRPVGSGPSRQAPQTSDEAALQERTRRARMAVRPY